MTLNPETFSEDLVSLDYYQELAGRLHRIETESGYLYITLSSGTVRIPETSSAAERCRAKLVGNEGAYVQLLKTPLPGRSIVIRVRDS